MTTLVHIFEGRTWGPNSRPVFACMRSGVDNWSGYVGIPLINLGRRTDEVTCPACRRMYGLDTRGNLRRQT